jgi:hypothetical protein
MAQPTSNFAGELLLRRTRTKPELEATLARYRDLARKSVDPVCIANMKCAVEELERRLRDLEE